MKRLPFFLGILFFVSNTSYSINHNECIRRIGYKSHINGTMLLDKSSCLCVNKLYSVVDKRMQGSPDMSVFVMKDNEEIFSHSTIAENKPIFHIASMSKMMTAALIAILEERHLLSIEDYLMKYVNNLPKQYNKVKIKHLLFHTSGIPDYLNDPSLDIDEMYNKGNVIDLKYLFQYINKLSSTNKPGQTYKYSNTNYVLLSIIIEKLSGMKYHQFLQQEVFNPLDMKDSYVSTQKDKNHDKGGYKIWPLFKEAKPRSAVINFAGDQGVFVSTRDYKKFINGLIINKKIFKHPNTLDKFLYYGHLDNNNMCFGAPFPTGDYKSSCNRYTYGLRHSWMVEKNHNIIYHCGNLDGYNGCFLYEPNKNAMVVILANFNFSIFNLAYEYMKCF